MKNKFRVFLLLAFIGANARIAAQCRLDYSNYHMVLDEEFNEPASYGGSLSLTHLPSYWKYDMHGWGGANEAYFPDKVSLVPDPGTPSNYFLRLTATKCDPVDLPICPDMTLIHVPLGDPPRPAFYASGCIRLDKDLAVGPTGIGCSDCNFDGGTLCDGKNYWGGFIYGIFETRMKIPEGDTWPAFWMDGPLAINIYEGKENPFDFGTGYNGQFFSTPTHDWMWHETVPQDLSKDFHVYTCVWTKDQISFFLDGIELCSYSNANVEAVKACFDGPCPGANPFEIALQMRAWPNSDNTVAANPIQECYLDIDYIRVWKPNERGVEDNYRRNPNEFRNFNVFNATSSNPYAMSTSSSLKVKNEPQAITVSANPGEVFFANESDGRMYHGIKVSNDNWNVNALNCAACVGTYGPGSAAAAKVKGDVTYNFASNKVIYKGMDDRLQYYSQAGYPATWYQAYIDNNFSTLDFTVSNIPGSICCIQDNIFYIDHTNKIRMCKYDPLLLNYTYDVIDVDFSIFTNLAFSDIVGFVNGTDYELFYIGFDFFLHNVKINSTTLAAVSTILGPSPALNYRPIGGKKSIALGQGEEIFYIGWDHYIHRYHKASGSWVYDDMTYAYGSPLLGYLNADFAREGITYSSLSRKVIYCGYDGCIQCFGWNSGAASWYHAWIDDYFGTNRFRTFPSTYGSDHPSLLCSQTDEAIYYSGAFVGEIYQGIAPGLTYLDEKFNLRYFIYHDCDILNPSASLGTGAESWMNAAKQSQGSSIEPKPSSCLLAEVQVFPNPAQDQINISYPCNSDGKLLISVKDVSDRIIFTESVNCNNGTILKHSVDISALPVGVYLVDLTLNDKHIVKKITKI